MSQPNWKGPFSLAIILCALGGFAFWHEFKHKPQEEEQAEQSKKILSLGQEPLHSVSISNGSRSVTLECEDFANKLCRAGDNSKWQITSPVKVKADDNNSNSLLSTLNSLMASDTISLKDETPDKRAALLKEYGLDPASLTHDRRLELDTAKGSTVLYLGLTHPIGEGIFAALEKNSGAKASGKIDDTVVYVLPSYVKTSFERDVTYWRDKKILPLVAHEVEGFDLKGPKGDVHGERKNGVWTLRSKKEEVQGDTESMDTLLTGVTYLTAKDFISDNKKDAKSRAELKGAKQVVSIAIHKEHTPEPIVLTLYQKPASRPAKGVVQYRVFATVSTLDPLFEVEAYAKERVNKSIDDLRLTKLITPMDRFGAKRLEFDGGSYGTNPWVLVNKDGKWSVDGKSAAAVNSEKIQGFLDHLTSTKIQVFVDKGLPKEPPESSTLTFTLGDDTSPAKRKVVFWREVGKLGTKLYARDLLSNRKEVFLMDNSLASAIPWDKAQLK